jgi:hypothetical protein
MLPPRSFSGRFAWMINRLSRVNRPSRATVADDAYDYHKVRRTAMKSRFGTSL